MADKVQQITPNAPQTAVVDPLHVHPKQRPGRLPGSNTGSPGEPDQTGLVDPFAECRDLVPPHMPND